MKILQVVDTLGPGGAERVALNLSNLLDGAGHEVHILCLDKVGSLYQYVDHGISVTCVGRTKRISPKEMRSTVCGFSSYDVIHVHMRHVFKYVFYSNLIFGSRKKLLFHDHSGNKEVRLTNNPLLVWAMRNSTYIGVSRDQVQWAKEDLQVDKAYLLSNVIVPHGVKERGEKKSQTSKRRLIIVSNIRRLKNIEFAIDLLINLNKADEGVFFLDIYGVVVDRGYYDKLRERIQKGGQCQQVNFIQDCSNVQSQLSQYDLAIHTSPSETGPLVLMEYLAHGLPFLSFKTGEVVEQVKEDLPSAILDNFELNNWIHAIRQVMDHNDYYSPETLKEVFNKYYSTSNYIRECLRIYAQHVQNY